MLFCDAYGSSEPEKRPANRHLTENQTASEDLTMAHAKYVFLNGEQVEWDNAKVHVASAAFKFGAAVFEGVRGYWNEEQAQMYLFRLDDHMHRLTLSQQFMRFAEIKDTAAIGRQTIELVRANQLRENIHVISTTFVDGFGGPSTTGPIGVSITTGPWVGKPMLETGCAVQVSSWQRVPETAMPMRVKCNANYQNGRMAAVQAETDGYDAALLLNTRGKIAEGPSMCFFMIRNGVAVTPPVTSDILESITRQTLLEILPDKCGVPVEERDIDRSELASADEAFFCGTAWEVTPIVSVDRLAVGTGAVGPVVRELQKVYFAITTGRDEAYAHWRTPVY